MSFEIIPVGTNIDFLSKRKLCAALSLGLLAVGALAIPLRGIQLGIDFEGGTEVQVRFVPGLEVDEGVIREIAGQCGIAEATVIRYGETDEDEYLVRFQIVGGEAELGPGAAPADCPLTDADRAALARAAAAGGGEGGAGEKGELVDRLEFGLRNDVGDLEVLRVEFVGPQVGAELRRDGLLSLFWASLLILFYIAFRFSMRFAPGAIVALIHDVGITSSIFVILGLEFDLKVLAALLAIIGYSLNDTIIIYDRIRENMLLHTKTDLIETLNRSVNQTLSRTILTSGTTLAVVLLLFFLGGEVIRPFATAMAIGVLVGTYSSVFIAAPTLLFLETRASSSGSGGSAGESARKEARPRGQREKKRDRR